MPLVSRSSNLGTRPIDPAGGCAYAPREYGISSEKFCDILHEMEQPKAI